MAKQVHTTAGDTVSEHELRGHLKRILLSRQFVKAKKKSRFLEFMCDQVLAGTADQVNEYIVGTEIYERGADFNPQEDSIVRVQAHEIRKSLSAYYELEGREDRLRIDLPLGGYVPVFRKMEARLPPAAPPEDTHRNASPTRPPGQFVVAAAIVCAVALGWLLRGVHPPQSSPPGLAAGAAWFWQPFLPPAAPPLVVLPVHPLLRAAHGGDSPATWERGLLIPKDQLPEFRDTIHFRELPEFRFVPNTTDFTAIGEALGLLDFAELLGSAGQKIRATAGRLVDYETIKKGNTILLGGNQSWSGRVFLYKEGFEFHNGVITNRKPLPGERAVYRPEFDPVTGALSRDYALILMLPNERREQRILLIYGIYTQGSEAAIEYVTNAERLEQLRQMLARSSPDRKTIPSYFQVLLSTSVENYVPGQVSLVSTRVIPESTSAQAFP